MKKRLLILGAAAWALGSCLGGALQIRQGGDGGITFFGGSLSARVFLPEWESARVVSNWEVREDGARTFKLRDALGDLFTGVTRCKVIGAGELDCDISLVALRECKLESVCLSYSGMYSLVSGRNWQADERQLTLPEKQRSSVFLADGRAGKFELPLSEDKCLRLEFPEKVAYYAQDSRQWNPNWSLRIGGRGGSFTCQQGERFSWKFRISYADGIEFRQDRPYTIEKGDVWMIMRNFRNIVPGSALDFSTQGLQDAPAGKYGWLKAVGDHFEFAGRPGVEQRFYGVNLCDKANYLDHSYADEFIDRLVRLGYNSIRLHHHDNLWRNPVRQDQMDYLVARAIEKGLYITTDLYVSRKVKWRDIKVDREGEVNVQLFKALVTCYEPAYENWCAFAREFLEHVNPYTGRAYKDEPAMPLISLINEGTLGMNWGKSGKPSDERIHAAWREFGGAGPMPAPGNAAFVRFDDWLNERFLKKAIPFLRNLGVKALITNDNNGGYHHEGESNTRFYDYVDNHFYVDHPVFLDVPWRPPSRCPNENPILTGDPKIFSRELTKGASRPYVISEWNFSGPGRYRALGGLLTGAKSSLQGWDGLWRFAYSHSDYDVTPPERCQPGLFDCATDPLIQASDRASICLFLRRDISEGDAACYWADKAAGTLHLVTPRTCGGFAPVGRLDLGPLQAEITGAPATLWVSALDDKPITTSDRLLLTHLTDVQAEGNRYADETRKVILKWGRGGVIERGAASVELKVDRPEGLAVYELDTVGNRTGEISSEVRNGRLEFSVSTHGPRGGRIYYEIVRTADEDSAKKGSSK